MYDLNETIELMTSADYKDRFKAEFWQTKIRCDKLKQMVEKYKKGELDFEPTCTIGMLEQQIIAMMGYMNILAFRAGYERIDLG